LVQVKGLGLSFHAEIVHKPMAVNPMTHQSAYAWFDVLPP
jgi:hypothetical protein